jgi:hypothetical protein
MIRRVTADDAPRTPLDHALDVFLYLPVGLMFELPRAIPRFIARGRRELHADAGPGRPVRLLDPARQLDRVQAHAQGTLRALGVLPPSGAPPEGRGANGRGDPGGPAAAGAESGRPARAAESGRPARAAESGRPARAAESGTTEQGAPSTLLAAVPDAEPEPDEAEATVEPRIDPDDLAVTGYDSLSASQVVPRLESLTTDELELVRQYELANRGRKTILNKIAQLQAR